MAINKNILIDYDGTFAHIPEAFTQFIMSAESLGWTCYVVSQRLPIEPIKLPEELEGVQIIYTSHAAKVDYCREVLGLEFGIYIDDKPISLFCSSETCTMINRNNKSKDEQEPGDQQVRYD